MERKSCWPLILCLIVAAIMGLLAYMHLNRELLNKLTNEIEFVKAAVRETEQSIESYNLEVEYTQKEMDNADKEVKELQDEVVKLTSSKEEKDKEVKACKDSVAVLNNDVTAVEKEKSDTDGNFASEKTKWSEEMNGLIKQLQESSQVCAYAKVSPEDLVKDPTLKDLCPQIQIITKADLPQ
ncbi:hypothetical protein DPX16_11506 [Anabarilius grahami]|uniref:Uncharacterized protein n=1 Tax=Anabarilius grahami TaxID=495550 RepID=A0A3N0YIU6_ANAGA|nr:hypothetical protein DPX16_11506 [Anabarilius grahami]